MGADDSTCEECNYSGHLQAVNDNQWCHKVASIAEGKDQESLDDWCGSEEPTVLEEQGQSHSENEAHQDGD